MIIWGFRFRWSRTKEGGVFECPDCGVQRQWLKVLLRRWFTLFFLPLFPISKVVEEAVECQTCKEKFKPDVLTRVTRQELYETTSRVLRCGVIATVRAVGSAGPTERSAVVATIGQRFGGYDEAAFNGDLHGLDLTTLDHDLELLSAHLSPQDKEAMLSAIAAAPTAGGFLDAARPTLERIGVRLGMTDAHVRGVLTDAAQPNAGPSDRTAAG